MRIASNSSELIDAVRERCGIEIELISSEQEARCPTSPMTSRKEGGSR
jgi:exopolyphosphatase/pppGpp-phosphohydrolase